MIEVMWLIIATVAAAFIGCLIGAAFLRTFYVIVPPNKALVRIGGQTRVVRNSGTLVIPILHQTKTVSLEAFSVPFHIGDVITGDMLRLSMEGSILVQVEQTDAAVRVASTAFTDSDESLRVSTARAVDTLIIDAVRTSCVRYPYVELVTYRQVVSNDIHELVEDEFSRLGLRVLSMSISQIVQTGTWEIE